MKYFIGNTLLLLCFLSCTNDQEKCDFPLPDYLEIGISNSQGVSLINGIYKQDSFKLYNNSESIYLKPVRFGGDSTLLAVGYPNINSDTDYLLELDSAVIDTFNFKFDQNSNDFACSAYILTEIEYNGTSRLITDDEGRYYFVRD